MEYQTIIFEIEDGFAIITLNRPERLNALSRKLYEEFEAVLNQLEKDDEVKALVLAGAKRPDGRPCFSAGADIKEIAELGAALPVAELGSVEEGVFKTLQALGESRDMTQHTYNKLEAFSKPTIAAIDGVCSSGGLEIALACDIRVAAKTAQFSDLHMKNLSVLGGDGTQTRLPRVVGGSKAKELAWAGTIIDGEEAWRIGLVDEVFPSDRMMDEAKNLARQIASRNLLALRMSKQVINASLSQGVHESLRYSALCEALLRYMRPKYIEAFQAFSKKRG